MEIEPLVLAESAFSKGPAWPLEGCCARGTPASGQTGWMLEPRAEAENHGSWSAGPTHCPEESRALWPLLGPPGF